MPNILNDLEWNETFQPQIITCHDMSEFILPVSVMFHVHVSTSYECVDMCLFKLSAREKVFWQMWH